MMKSSRQFLWVVSLSAICCAACAQDSRFTVTNPSAVVRRSEAVVVPWKEVAENLSDTGRENLKLTDNQGRAYIFQIDDLDMDGIPDELAFVADFGPGEARMFTLALSAADSSAADRPMRTDAQNWKRVDGVLRSVDDDDLRGADRDRKAYRFDGVGWESENAAYRLYLDGRNAVDIQGKRTPGLRWKWIGESGVDYQLDAEWGTDVLHVGAALGVGGIGFWVGDSVLKPLILDRQRCRIIARGPVRAVVRVDYTGWEAGSRKLDVTSLFSIYDGDRMTEHRVTVRKGGTGMTLATGIVKHDSADVVWNPEGGWLYTIGPQSRAGDTLLMALNVLPSSVVRKTEDALNHLLLLKVEEGTPLSIVLSSCWQGEAGTMMSRRGIHEFLIATGRRLREPLETRILQ